MNEFGNFLYTLRKEKGMTQTELADRLGVTNKAVSKWETGESFPETAQLVPLSGIFGVTVDELLKGRRDERIADGTQDAADSDAQYLYDTPAEAFQPAGWRTKFAIAMSAGVMLILFAVVALVLTCVFADNNVAVVGAVCGFLGVIAVAVFVFVTFGILNENLHMPVEDANWKRNVVRFSLSIASGVALCILAAACFVGSSLGADAGKGAIADKAVFVTLFTIAFVLIAAAVGLFVFSGIAWDSYCKRVDREWYLARKRAERDSWSGRAGGIIMMLAVIVFLLCGFLGNYWHPAWVVFPVGGILCGILGALDKNGGNRLRRSGAEHRHDGRTSERGTDGDRTDG